MKVKRKHSGMALVLVVCVMALAAVLSYALLATASIQAAASNNAMAGAIAQAQAEAGVKLAMYYLLNPQYAPSQSVVNSVAFWPGATDVTFSTTGSPSTQMPGSVTINVTAPTNQLTNIYTVVSTGSITGMGEVPITRTITAQVELTYQVQQAMALNQSLVSLGLGVTVNGSPTAISASGTLSLLSGANISGSVSAASLSQSLGSILNGSILSAPTSNPAPPTSAVNHYSTYLYQGNTYSAVALGSSTLNSGNIPVYDAVHNPLNVFYYNGNVTVAGPVTFTGTLVAVNGNVIVQGSGSTMTAGATMPALVIDKSLEVKSTNATITVNGAVYAATGVATGGGINTGDKVTINGGLMVNSGAVTPPVGATITVNYNSTYAAAPALSSSPNAVQLVSWSE
jgi:Tfp pilus assembly protein PilX